VREAREREEREREVGLGRTCSAATAAASGDRLSGRTVVNISSPTVVMMR
jgi:hypothetical protein